MKTLFIQLALIVLCATTVMSQRLIDPPYTAEHFNGQYRTNTTTPININFSDTALFCAQPNQFLFGYQWGGGANLAMERRFGTNSPHIQQYAGHDTNSIKALKTGATLYGVYSYQSISNVQQFQTTCMEYRPCAPLWDTEHEYIPIPGDKTGAIFGFNTKIDSCVITDSTSPEFMRYVVKPSILNGLSSKLILGRPWESSHPIRTDDTVSAKNNPNHIEAMKNGTRWYLNVNLKRLNNDSTQTDNERVLTIKVKYWFKEKVGALIFQRQSYIQFDSVFTYNNTSDTMHTARGITHRHLSPVNFGDKTQFIIRRKDIPVYGSVDSLRDISLSAYFRTASIGIVNDTFSTKHTPNLWFQQEHPFQLNAIDSFDIQVTYNGGCPISISHISLLTPRAKELLFGYGDKALADGLDTLVSDVRTLHNKYLDSNKYLKLYRIYAHDEPQPRTWRIERYLNKLFGGYITAKGTELTAYQHLVGQKDFWNGNGIDQMNRQRTAYKVSNPQNKDGLEIAGWNWNDIPNGIYGYQKYECIECYNNWKYGFPTNGSTKLPDVGLPSNTYQSLCAMEENAKNGYRQVPGFEL